MKKERRDNREIQKKIWSTGRIQRNDQNEGYNKIRNSKRKEKKNG